MKIELLIGGKNKAFKTGFISGMVFRNAIQIQKRVQDEGLQIELLDDLVDFAVKVFGNQFTSEEFYEGVSFDRLFDVLMHIIMFCINGTEPTQDTQ